MPVPKITPNELADAYPALTEFLMGKYKGQSAVRLYKSRGSERPINVVRQTDDGTRTFYRYGPSHPYYDKLCALIALHDKYTLSLSLAEWDAIVTSCASPAGASKDTTKGE